MQARQLYYRYFLQWKVEWLQHPVTIYHWVTMKVAVAIFIILVAAQCYEVFASEGRLVKWCIRAFNNLITLY